MQARNCRERVLKLKEWRITYGKTVDQCIELCGGFPSDVTIRRIFAKGSEDKAYRESTVAAIEQAIFGQVYMPEIKIPVEAVIKAEKEQAEKYNADTKKQALRIAQQRANIRVRDFIIIALVLYEIIVIIYDRMHPTIGFYTAGSITVWAVQTILFVVIASILSVYILRTRLRARQLAQEDEP